MFNRIPKIIPRALVALALGAAPLAASFSASAQEAYPSRPLTAIVPFPPGGYADIMMRAIAPSLERALGQPIVIMNRAGAAGAVGAAAGAAAKPDGYTFIYTLASLITLPEQAIVNNQKPLFTLNELTPLARVTTDHMAVVVRADSKYKTLGDLIAAAKARPGEIPYASSGNYGSSHVPSAMFADAAGVKFNHVPYPGGAQMITALMAGDVEWGVYSRSFVAQQVASGKFRYLASFGRTKWTNPPIPSFADYGLDADYEPWTGAFLPAKVPEAMANRLREAFRTAVKDPEFKQVMERMGTEVLYQDGEELNKFWATDVKRVTEAVRKIGKIE